MYKAFALFAAVVTLSSGAFANTITQAVGAQATYLHLQSVAGPTQGVDTGVTAVVIDLFANGMTAGQTIVIRSSGNLCYNPTNCSVASGQLPAQIIGAFANSNTILASTNAARITALLTSLGQITTVATFDHNEVTDIPNDFAVATSTVAFTGTSVVIPAGGQFLILGIHDSRYADNSEPNSPGDIFGFVDFAVSGVPEPASFGMIGAGLLALGAILRKRRS